MRIEGGWLDTAAPAPGDPRMVLYPSVRHKRLIVPTPIALVWHTTDMPNEDPAEAEALAKRIQRFDMQRDRAASWHFLIAKNGALFQSVSCLRGSWHCAPAGLLRGVRGSINKRSVGVEVQNAGRLRKLGSRYYSHPFYIKNTKTPDPKRWMDPARVVVAEANGRGWAWDHFTAPQIETARRLVRALATAYQWGPDDARHGHVDFDPERRSDPGPLWSTVHLPLILAAVFPLPGPVE